MWSVLCQYELCGSVVLKMVVTPMLGCKNTPYVTHATFIKYINRVFSSVLHLLLRFVVFAMGI